MSANLTLTELVNVNGCLWNTCKFTFTTSRIWIPGPIPVSIWMWPSRVSKQ